jgi:hypothetical protein
LPLDRFWKLIATIGALIGEVVRFDAQPFFAQTAVARFSLALESCCVRRWERTLIPPLPLHFVRARA